MTPLKEAYLEELTKIAKISIDKASVIFNEVKDSAKKIINQPQFSSVTEFILTWGSSQNYSYCNFKQFR